jgi:hypothetical protein
MARNNRISLRIFLIVVLIMGFVGAWYASNNWQPQFETIDLSLFSEEGDWIETLSALGEESIQLIMGVLSPES